MNHTSLHALEEAQQDATAAAKRRIEQAEEHLNHYRTQLFRVEETAYRLAQQQGIADHPDFTTVLQGVSQDINENIRGGAQAIGRLEEDLTTMTRQHNEQREQFLTQLG